MRSVDKPIYLDFNATTPVDPRVAEAMLPFLAEYFGNPSSGHSFGQKTRQAVDKARSQVANFLGASESEIIFTSGGTEANNHAIIGAALARQNRGRHIITSQVEHPAVIEVFRHLESLGFQATYVGVDSHGLVDAEEMIAAMTEETVLVSLMHANNEVGTLQPVPKVAAAARQRGILSHSDCAQSAGKVPVTRGLLEVDMISLAGHKLYAPKGIGVLCVKTGTEIKPLMYGAGHESGRRPGTENILEIVGLGQACELAAEDLKIEMIRLSELRDQLQEQLQADFPAAKVHGHPTHRLPNTLSIAFPGCLAADIMAAMPQIAVSAGAACHDDGAVVSTVLSAMKVDPEWARGTLRISLGRMTTSQEIKTATELISAAVQKCIAK